jgi:hypothetical protein
MSTINRFVVCASFFMAALCLSVAASAQASFDGTWRTDLSKTSFSPKPIIFYISKGWYHCISCTPPFDVPADGQDHAVVGEPYDTIAVTIVDDHTITTKTKRGDKVIGEQTRKVSDDGKFLKVSSTQHPMNSDKPATFETKAHREGMLHEGAHPTSGRWIIVSQQGSDNGLLTTYKVNGDQITMTEATGENYTAKLDGSDYPVKGAYGWDAVSLKRIDDHTIEETDKRDKTDKRDTIVIAVYRMSVAGKTMTVVEHDKLTGRDSTYVATKQ